MNNVGVLAVHPDGTIVRVFPGSAAEQAGVLVGDRIETINGKSPASIGAAQFLAVLQESSVSLTLAHIGHPRPIALTIHTIPYSPNLKPEGRRLDGDVGYLDLPGQIGGGPMQSQYAPTAQQVIREVDQRATCGWVVDVRRNPGGNVWPMLAGVGPVLGEGEVNSSVSAEGEKIATVSRHGQALYGRWVNAQVDDPYRLKRPAPPVAVLTSQLTRSSGEHVVLAFRGRRRTRSFGEPTAGDPTANAGKVFSDGAALFLTVAFGTDRMGQSSDGPLVPDHPVKIDWMLLGTWQDPVLQAALEWLHHFAGSASGVDI